MVQTGFRAEAHCWKCFKVNADMTFLDGKAVNLCKGCIYVVKQFSQWLNAYGLGIREIIPMIPDAIEEGKDRVEGEENPSTNGRTQDRVVKTT